MPTTDAETASLIADLDQRQARLTEVRLLVTANTKALVEKVAAAILEAQEESFNEVAERLRDEEARILRADRRRAKGE